MISPTIKLYDNDAYVTEFDAEVISSEPIMEGNNKGAYKVLLDQTCFFPEEGGQTCDRGRLEGTEVQDVQIVKRDGAEYIYHTVSAELEVGEKVHGIVDWNHRFDQMQQHSGEHIFSGTVHNRYGYDNVGFHLSDSIVTMDFNGPLTDDQVQEIETDVNRIIIRNLEIQISWPSAEELDALQYRSKKELDGAVRIVTIPGVDICACCAPHVKRTGEIGFLKVINRQNYKGGVRITIECGLRALQTLDYEHAMLTSIAADMTTSVENVPDQIRKIEEENYALRGKLSTVNSELLNYKLSEIPADQKNVALFPVDMDNKTMQNTINALVKTHPGYCAVFTPTETGYRFIIGTSTGDARTVADILKDRYAAKCGGSAQMVQGSLNMVDSDDLKNVVLAL